MRRKRPAVLAADPHSGPLERPVSRPAAAPFLPANAATAATATATAQAIADASQLQYFTYFLDQANHAPGVPLDMISYHLYAQPSGADTVDTYGPNSFPGAGSFIATVAEIESIRERLAPQVRTTVDEVGSILGSAATQPDPAPIPDGYWNYSGAIYAYVLANLALQGIDVVGESQLVGYPSQFPSVSMAREPAPAPC